MSEVLANPSNLWEVKPLSDLTDAIQYGYTAKAKTDAAGIRYLRITDIQDDHVEWSTVPSCDVSEVESEKYLLAAGDLVFARTGATVGKSFLIRGNIPKSVFASYLIRVRLRKHIDPRYVAHFFQSPSYWNQIAESSAGIGQPNVNGTKLAQIQIPVAPLDRQAEIVDELEKQFSRLDEAVANLQRVKANLKRYERATIASLTNPESFDACVSGTIADIATSLDNMRKPVNKLERAKRPGNVPYLGANGQTGWIDVPLFDEELVMVVEDETFVGRTDPFCYYFAAPCWVNNHTHVLRARPEVVSAKYLNLALSYYPFIPLTTGSTGRRKLTKAALMTAPITVPSLRKQAEVIDEVERCLSIAREVEAEVDTNLKRAQALRQSTLAAAFAPKKQRG